MSGFPNFQDFGPLDITFTCIHPCKSSKEKDQPRCSRPVSRDDRRLADKLRSDILLSEGPGEHLRQWLKRYAELCCCKQSHRSKALKLGYIDEVATKWLSQLAGQLQVVLTTEPAPSPTPRFLPYRSNKQKDRLQYAFLSPLSPRDTEDGTLYMVGRHEDVGYKKIGFTQKVADERYKFFESSCGFEPLPLRQIRRIPNIRRVELLVHAELNEYRRECTTCTRRVECGSLHTEWFEVDEGLAMAVMEKWSLWMSDADPYEIGGQLKEFWRKFLLGLQELGLLPTSMRVMAAWHEQQAQEDYLVAQFSRLQLGRKFSAPKMIAYAP